MAERRPENRIAITRRVTRDDVSNLDYVRDVDIGRWAVEGASGHVQVCENYTHASSLASALNRSPA